MTLFTDESEFLLNPKTTNKKNDVVWARRREKVPTLGQYNLGWSLCAGKARLLVCNDDLTGPKYLALLKKAKPDVLERHLARTIETGHLFMMVRPPQSKGGDE